MATHLASRPRWPFNALSAAIVAISVLVPFAAGRPAAQSDAPELPFLGPDFSHYPYAATICLGEMARRDGCSQDSEKAYYQCMCTDSNHLTHSKAAAECMMLLTLAEPAIMTRIYDLIVDQCKSADTPLSIFTLKDWLAWGSEAMSGTDSTTGDGDDPAEGSNGGSDGNDSDNGGSSSSSDKTDGNSGSEETSKSKGLERNDIIAIAVGIASFIVAVVSSYFAYKAVRRRMNPSSG